MILNNKRLRIEEMNAICVENIDLFLTYISGGFTPSSFRTKSPIHPESSDNLAFNPETNKFTDFTTENHLVFSNVINYVKSMLYYRDTKIEVSEWAFLKELAEFNHKYVLAAKLYIETFIQKLGSKGKVAENELKVLVDKNSYKKENKKNIGEDLTLKPIEETFKEAYGVSFPDLGYKDYNEFKKATMTLLSDTDNVSDSTGKKRYTKEECEYWGIYKFDTRKPEALIVLNKLINLKKWALRDNLKNYFIFELQNDKKEVVGLMFRFYYKKETMLKKNEKKQIIGNKYLFTKYRSMFGFKKGAFIYGLWNFYLDTKKKNDFKKNDYVVLIESPSDLMTIRRNLGNDICSHVLPLYTCQITLEQVEILKSFLPDEIKIISIMDNDESGQRGNKQVLGKLQSAGFKNLYIGKLENGKDFDETSELNIDGFNKMINDSLKFDNNQGKEKITKTEQKEIDRIEKQEKQKETFKELFGEDFDDNIINNISNESYYKKTYGESIDDGMPF